MKIEALENFQSGDHRLTAGDVVTVPDETGARWCALGWAKDPSGTIPTGERRVLDARLVIDPAAHAATAQTVGG
jgi:hypothetical protein